jgi:Transcriptional regulatory protein, C terminal
MFAAHVNCDSLLIGPGLTGSGGPDNRSYMGSLDQDHGTTDGDRDPTATGLPVVIGVAPALADRVRLAELLDGFGPVGLVLVATIEEARLLLDNATNGRRNGQANHHPNHTRVKQLAGLKVDSDLLLANRNGHRVGLTPLEHDLLVCLGSEPRQTWTHAALHETVWNTRHAGGQADIHSVVKRLRRKLANLGAPATIEAVRGVGFRLEDTEPAI